MRVIQKLSEIQEIELNLKGSFLKTEDEKIICELLSSKNLARISLGLEEN